MQGGRPSYNKPTTQAKGMPPTRTMPPPAYNQAWKDNLKRLHSQFTFDQPTDLLAMKVEEPKAKR